MIPLATTTISVLRIKPEDVYDEPYGGERPTDRDVAASGVRAVIYRPVARSAGREQRAGGEQAIAELDLACDPCGITYLDWIKDDTTGAVYEVIYALAYPGDHEEAGLRLVEGET